MPIYEYKCESCGKYFEIFQKISDPPLTECKFCKGRLTKLISNCAFHLKGSGWYVTDYKKPVDSVSKVTKPTNGNGSGNGKQPTSEATATTDTKASSETKSTEA
ncbi:MAG TPA: zinc ribbon domain-containing protein [Syntrophorhabdaceae bacterium]|nr:zinc ribbon domain-containing protein [Syntrophorhabdaceae bacterium]